MKSASGSMSSDENGLEGGTISSDEKEMKSTSGNGMEIQVFWNENNSKKNAYSHYSNSSVGLIPNQCILNFWDDIPRFIKEMADEIMAMRLT